MRLSFQTLIIAAFFVAGCSGISKSNLIGKWQAVTLIENDKKQVIDLSEVGLEFNKDGGYRYTGTLNYSESGYFDMNKDLLFTIDTINNGSSEKTVQILQLSSDTLKIKMQEANNVRVIHYLKKG